MAIITDLSTEVMDKICLYLRMLHINGSKVTSASSRKGLLSLCTTSRMMNEIALPHLYHHIAISNFNNVLVPLMHSLWNDRSLSALIHEIKLDDLDMPRCNDERPEDCMEKSRKWQDSCPKRIVAMLLSVLHNLCVLDMTSDRSFEIFSIRCLEIARNIDSDNPPSLAHVKAVTLRHHNVHQIIEMAHFASFMNGRSIEKLSVVQPASFEGVTYCDLSALRELRFLSGGLVLEEIADVVRWCPKLELLWLEASGCSRGDNLHLAHIGPALFPLRHTLRTLILHGCWQDRRSEEESPSLAKFSKLQNLIIGMTETYGSSYVPFLHDLPASIEHLVILGMHQRIMKNVQSWASRDRTSTPNMKTFIVDASLNLEPELSTSHLHYKEISYMERVENDYDAEEFWKELVADAGYRLLL